MPQIIFAKSNAHDVFQKSEILAVGVPKNSDGKRTEIAPNCPFTKALSAGIETLDASADAGEVTKLAVDSRLIFAAGLANCETDDFRQSAGAVTRAAAGKDSLTIYFPHATAAELSAILEGAFLGSYQFNKYLQDAKSPVAQVTVISDLEIDFAPLLDRAKVITQAVNRVRDLTNLPANELNPQTFADVALQEAAAAGVSVKIYENDALAAEKLAGLIAVGKGSAVAPRLIRLEWAPKDAQAFIALVGKGITFDTGGYSLKPSAHITEMKTDMCGAATVLETLIAAAKLAVPVKLVGWLCMAENMVSATATRPDDVIVYRNGKSVEINNTDAEGRLVMADGLIMACEENPDAVIDIATLTGAQMVALGEQITGVMGTPEVREQVLCAAESVDESAWGMPLPKQLRESLKSDIATLKNSGSRYGGMLVAGLFLQEFVGQTPWAHLDIAGPSFNRNAAAGYTPKGGTGVMLRTLLQFIEMKAQS